MIDQVKNFKCNGCKACRELCPQQAIDFVTGNDGFWYPEVGAHCVNCGLCVERCPQINGCESSKEMPKVFAAWSLNDDTRMASTSGGLYYELAAKIIQEGGSVVACRYSPDFKSAYHSVADNTHDVYPQMGSKHLQSNTEKIYSEVKSKLDDKVKTMFVGSPCQVAGLYAYLGSDADNLVTCDFICNSINSPKAHARYIEYLERVYGAPVIKFRTKDKRNGWNNFGSSASFSNGNTYFADKTRDLRVISYHRGHLFIRECCTECRFKTLPRVSDITLGDFWGIEQSSLNPKLELGTSVVLVNSKKAQKLFTSIADKIGFYEKSYADVRKGNPSLEVSAKPNSNREKALSMLDNMPFEDIVNEYSDKITLLKRMMLKLRNSTRTLINVARRHS
jgi:coenzyme F420-reducing hydrogenase beta subunit